MFKRTAVTLVVFVLAACTASTTHALDSFIISIDSTTSIYGGVWYVANIYEDGEFHEHDFMVVENDTVYWRGAQVAGWSSPNFFDDVFMPLFPTVGTEWYGFFSGSTRFYVQDYIPVVVPLGSLMAYHIVTYDSATGQAKGYINLSPNVGTVAFKDGDTELELIDTLNVSGTGTFPLAVGNYWEFEVINGIRAGYPKSPMEFSLHPNHPNPFNPSTVLSFELRAASFVRLEVFNPAGSWITTLAEGWKAAGVHEVIFNGTGLPSGMYLARLQAGNYAAVQKMVLLK